MEFSFDRGQKSPKSSTNTTQTASDPYADARSQHLKNAASGNASQFQGASSATSSGDSAEDRLKKAIERNRAKQEMRAQQEVKSQPQPQPQASGWTPGQVFNKPEVRPQSEPAPKPGPTPTQAQASGWTPGQVFNKPEAKPQSQPAPKPGPTPTQAQAGGWTPGQVFNKPDGQSTGAQFANQSQPGLFHQEEPRQEAPPKRPEVVRPEILNREGQKPLSERLAEAQKENFNRASSSVGTGARVNTRSTSANHENVQADILEKKIPTSRAVVARERRVTVEEEFTTPVKKAPKKITTPTYATKKNGVINPKWQNYLVKGCWAFCALMLVRLFLSQGGVMDYYDQSRVLGEKKLELEQIRSENMALTKEISRMLNDVGYQKKIVRDNLGFIAQDEFLILFPKE